MPPPPASYVRYERQGSKRQDVVHSVQCFLMQFSTKLGKRLGKAQSSEGDTDRKLSVAKPVDGKLDISGWGLYSLEGLLPSTRVEALYCRGNGLKSLHGMPILPKLHILDASANCLTDLAGLNTAPLRMMFLAANNIADVSSIPTIPTLEVCAVVCD